MFRKITFIMVLAMLASTDIQSAFAEETINGCFVAKRSCAALHSIRKHTNPGNIHLEPFSIYAVRSKNQPKATHYKIKITDGERLLRWVPASCGNYVANCRLLPEQAQQTGSHEAQYLLALSWEPTFCKSHSQKTECKTMTAGRFDTQHLALHGLWPQPRNNAYCGVDSATKKIDRRKKWHLLPVLPLSEATRQKLAVLMPGYASNLHRHEWIKHGVCFGTSAEVYYRTAIRLANDINHTLTPLIARQLGQAINANAIKAAFDKAYGQGAGKRVNMRCDSKGRLAELWINLQGQITGETSLSALLKNAPVAQVSCQAGTLDRVK